MLFFQMIDINKSKLLILELVVQAVQLDLLMFKVDITEHQKLFSVFLMTKP